MELEAGVLVSPTAEVPVIEGDIVTTIATWRVVVWGARRSRGKSASRVTQCGATCGSR